MLRPLHSVQRCELDVEASNLVDFSLVSNADSLQKLSSQVARWCGEEEAACDGDVLDISAACFCSVFPSRYL
jgi:hypothetical protein